MHLVRYICACNLYEVKVTVCCHKHDPYPPFSTYHSHSIHVYKISFDYLYMALSEYTFSIH